MDSNKFMEILNKFQIDYNIQPPSYVKEDLNKFSKLYNLYPDLGIIEFTYLFLIGNFNVNKENIIVNSMDKYKLKGIKIDELQLIKIEKNNEMNEIKEFGINTKSLYNIVYSCIDICKCFMEDYNNTLTKKAIDYLFLPEIIKKIQFIHYVFTFNDQDQQEERNQNNFKLENLSNIRKIIIELIEYFNEYDYENHTLFKQFIEDSKEYLNKNFK
jgi:hypothetical protein